MDSSSRATTGFIAVCQTTACPVLLHRPVVVADVVQVNGPRIAVLAGAGDVQPGTQVLPVILSPRVSGSGGFAATTSRGLTSW